MAIRFKIASRKSYGPRPKIHWIYWKKTYLF